ncbi:MAG: SDR family oxidoreductase [Planctomycetes bacterium]|nr:SDR family oxidoreductase [Planctomycetota bacterium]
MNRTVLVTGAARGIGLATARRFLAAGWQVALLDIGAPRLAAAHAGLVASHPDTLALPADVADPQQGATAVRQAHAAFGRLDALVNNAGIADVGPIQDTSYARWRRIMATNLDGPFLMTQAAAPLIAAGGGGAVVNITSISGHRASTLRTAYGTSKAALAHLTRQQAAELGELGIRVNAVAPGPVDTAMARKVHDAAIRAAYHDAIPLARYGLESEIADAIHFLCSAQASYITGQVLSVDGGFQATGIGLPALRGG